MFMAIVEFKALARRKVRGTHVEIGQPLYAIKQRGLYYFWAYASKRMAIAMDIVRESGWDSDADRDFNWRTSLDQLRATGRKDEA